MGNSHVRACVAIVVLSAAGCSSGSSDDTEGAAGASGLGGATSATGGSGGTSTGGSGGSTGGTGGNLGGSAGIATGGSGNQSAGGNAGSSMGAAGMGGSSGGGCPASGPVDIVQWETDPWVVPMPGGNPLQTIPLSNELGLHYQRFELDLDVRTADVGMPNVCFVELRNSRTMPNTAWRYFALCVKTDGPDRLINHVFTPEDGRVVTNFTMKPNTDYHVDYVWDSVANEATATLTEAGGSPVSATSTPLGSSISPQGMELRLLIGISATHKDVRGGDIVPPWGWTFSNLRAQLEPGGPHGPEALPCP